MRCPLERVDAEVDPVVLDLVAGSGARPSRPKTKPATVW